MYKGECFYTFLTQHLPKSRVVKPHLPRFPLLPQRWHDLLLLLLLPVVSSGHPPLAEAGCSFHGHTIPSLAAPAGRLIIIDSRPAALRNARRESWGAEDFQMQSHFHKRRPQTLPLQKPASSAASTELTELPCEETNMCLFISNFASQLLLLEIQFTWSLLLVGHFWFCLVLLKIFGGEDNA